MLCSQNSESDIRFYCISFLLLQLLSQKIMSYRKNLFCVVFFRWALDESIYNTDV